MAKPHGNLNINALCRRTTALGPGLRYVIWLQGCAKNCPGCISPDGLPFTDNIVLTPKELANDALFTEGIEGITISGGEPFLQAEDLITLIEFLKFGKPLSVIVYSGYTYEELLTMNAYTKQLLTMIDILIDGEYIEELNDDRGLRGSSNQRVIFLSGRYSEKPEVFETCIREIEIRKNIIIGIKPKGADHFLAELLGKRSKPVS